MSENNSANPSNSPPNFPTHAKNKKRAKIQFQFSYSFLTACMPIIAIAATIWAVSAIYFGMFSTLTTTIPSIIIIVAVIAATWITFILLSRKGKQNEALVVFIILSVLSGLSGTFHPLMIRIPIGCAIAINVWWFIGYLVHSVEHKPYQIMILVLCTYAVDLIAYWAVLTLIFHETILDWALYLVGNALILSGLVYDSFRKDEEIVQTNKMWAVCTAILVMFIAFAILFVLALAIVAAYFGTALWDLNLFTSIGISGSGQKKRKFPTKPMPESR
jgi:hypothetical protein